VIGAGLANTKSDTLFGSVPEEKALINS